MAWVALKRIAILIFQAALLLSVNAFASAAQAQQTWKEAISTSGCFSAPPDANQQTLVVSAWQGASSNTLLEQARKRNDVDGISNPSPEQLVQRAFVLSPEGLSRFKADLKEHRAITCLVAKYQSDPTNSSAQQPDEEEPQAFLKIAQFVLRLQGCPVESSSTAPTGRFGASSQASWGRVATHVVPHESIGKSPTASQTVRLIAAGYHPDYCEQTQPSTLPEGAMDAYVRLFAYGEGDAEGPDEVCKDATIKKDAELVLKAVRTEAKLSDGLRYIHCVPTKSFLKDISANEKSNPGSLRKYVRTLLGIRAMSRPGDVVDFDFYGPEIWQAETLLPAQYEISLEQIPDLLWLSSIIAKSPDALEVVLSDANSRGLAILGTLLTEGLSDAGRQIELGLRLFEVAAKSGHDFALLRLAQAYEQGYGPPANPARSIELYRELAARGQPAGHLALARLYEDGELITPDPSEAAKWYAGLLEFASKPRLKSGLVQGFANALQSRLTSGSSFLLSSDGIRLLEMHIGQNPDLAAALGDVFACANCGAVINLEQAAIWYRRSLAPPAGVGAEQDQNANEEAIDERAYKLARLLLAKPELAQSTQEAFQVLELSHKADNSKSALLRFYLDATRDQPDEPTLVARLEKKMSPQGCDGNATDNNRRLSINCIQFAHQLAIGAIDQKLVGYGYNFLARSSTQAIKAKKMDDPSIDAFVDVLAYYGDFRAAEALLAKSSVETVVYSARTAVIGRLLSQTPLKTPRLKELQSFLKLSAERGYNEANKFLDILEEQVRPVSEKPVLSEAAQYATRYREQAARGGISSGLVSATRNYSQVEFLSGAKEHAVELELASLNAEIQLEEVSAIFNGPIPSALTRVCLYAKSSRRIFEFGDGNLALVLAKTAVNELQRIRSELRQLPQQLQLCFADVVSNHYRWLADLLIQQNRNEEAVRVLGFLKNFETYDFLDKDDRYQGNAFETLRLTDDEAASREKIRHFMAPFAQLGRRERELLLKEKGALKFNTTLSEAEQKELASVRAQIAERAKQTDVLLQEIRVALKQSGDAQDVARLELGGLGGRLRQEYGGKAVAVHYVVLPDRMSAILTIPKGPQLSYTWKVLDGVPFSEEALNKKIAEFRAVLQKRSTDPVPAARAIYELLLGPFKTEIESVNPETMLISADRKLKLVPFAALHDGKKYLAESVGIIMMTPVPPSPRSLEPSTPIAAFGITKPVPGFAQLPNVKSELDALVLGKTGQGLFRGQEFVDQQFTRKTLAGGLLFGTTKTPKLGIVHIASHFKLGMSGGDSFLLLGNGEHLTLSDLRKNLGEQREFDFGDVDLLTLSACETAYAQPQADARALESLATAVQMNGVRSVIGTLWPIGDYSTPFFMRQFYSAVTRPNTSRDQALAMGQRALIASAKTARQAGNLLNDYSHPYHWASFVLMQGVQ